MKKEATKGLILKEALRLFSSYGYDSVSVGQIAEAVGYAHRRFIIISRQNALFLKQL